jgi:hypothetical protein
MSLPKGLCHSLALAAALLLSCFHVQAQLFRTYVASDGNDANPCTLPAPCRLLPAAITAVANGGEIWMLDSANYNSGPVNVTKSATILAIPGAVGSVVALGGAAIVVATPGVSLTLRNLVIVPIPGGGGTRGIDMTAGAALTVEGCLFANLPTGGIYVDAGPAVVSISDTTIRGTGSSGLTLVGTVKASVARSKITRSTAANIFVLNDSGAQGTLDVTDSVISGSGSGLYAEAHNAGTVSRVSVSNSEIVQHAGYGVFGMADLSAAVTLLVANNTITNNDYGLHVQGDNAKAWLNGNMVGHNNFGLSANGNGIVESAGNNAVRFNPSGNTIGSVTTIGSM